MNKKIVTGLVAGIMSFGMTIGAGAQDAAPQWTDNIKLGGDVRFRYQNTEEEGKDARERWRFRARLSLDAKVNDEVKANIRLVTNAGDPISDNITMDNYFDDVTARIDRAFLTYTPVENLNLRMGKMSQPWIAVDDLVMSGEANPEGLAANYKLGMDGIDILLHGGGFMLKERSAADETYMYSGQVAIRFDLGNKDYVMVGGSIYYYDNLKGTESMGGQNTTVKNDDGKNIYDLDITVVEGFAKAGLNLGLPVTLAAQYMVNTEADDNDTGYLGSFEVKLPHGFAVGYQYRYLEKDSTLSYLAEYTDFSNNTDVEGHIPYVTYQISKNFSIKALYAMGQRGLDNGHDIDTFKIDISGRF